MVVGWVSRRRGAQAQASRQDKQMWRFSSTTPLLYSHHSTLPPTPLRLPRVRRRSPRVRGQRQGQGRGRIRARAVARPTRGFHAGKPITHPISSQPPTLFHTSIASSPTHPSTSEPMSSGGRLSHPTDVDSIDALLSIHSIPYPQEMESRGSASSK